MSVLPGSEVSKQRGPNPSDVPRPAVWCLSMGVCCLLAFELPSLALEKLWLRMMWGRTEAAGW